MNKNFSIITNFWCMFSCSFCITSSQNTENNFTFTKEDEIKLEDVIKKHLDLWITRISISWGGDPFFIHNEEIKKFYKFLFILKNKLWFFLSIHTNFIWNIHDKYIFDKYVISVNKNNYKIKFLNWKGYNTRFVFVSNWNDLLEIKNIYKELQTNSQLTVKPLHGNNNDFSEIKSFLGGFKNTRFLDSWDYNIYYNLNDQKIYNTFKELNKNLIKNTEK